MGLIFDSTCIYRVLHKRTKASVWIVGSLRACRLTALQDSRDKRLRNIVPGERVHKERGKALDY